MHDIISPEVIAMTVGRGGWWSRSGIAKALNRGKTTWLIANIEAAVEAGLIEKFPGTIGKHKGWVYGEPGLQMRLLHDD